MPPAMKRRGPSPRLHGRGEQRGQVAHVDQAHAAGGEGPSLPTGAGDALEGGVELGLVGAEHTAGVDDGDRFATVLAGTQLALGDAPSTGRSRCGARRGGSRW